MNNKNNALVIIWKGNNIPDELAQYVAKVLISNNICEPEKITVKVLDEDAVTAALLQKTQNINNIIVEDENRVAAEAVKQAVIYIGERFKDSLMGTNGLIGNVAAFAIELSNAVITARRNISFIGVGSNDELLTAIKIISTTKAIVPQSLAKKYHFTQNVVDVIKKVYNSY